MINCNDYRNKNNEYSQYGEDGIIEFLLSQIGIADPSGKKFVIEFGAADGFWCSNTAKLWHNKEDCDALLIEGDTDKYSKLAANNFKNVESINAFVDNIDDFTTRVADVCSIDVDGNEYYIMARMKTRHRILIVENNPTVPPHIDMLGFEDEPTGASASMLCKLASHMGYTLVGATACNLIFIPSDVAAKFDFETDLNKLFDSSHLNYLVTDYGGNHNVFGKLPYGLQSKNFRHVKVV